MLLCCWRFCSCCGSSRRGGALAPKRGSLGRNIRVRVLLDENVPPLLEASAAPDTRKRATRERERRTVAGEAARRRAPQRAKTGQARTLAKMNSCTEGWLKTYTATTGAVREDGRVWVESGSARALSRTQRRALQRARTDDVDGKLETLQPGATHRVRLCAWGCGLACARVCWF